MKKFGKIVTMSTKKKRKTSVKNIWKIQRHINHGKMQTPDGTIYEVYNLNKFARENSINRTTLKEILTGKTKNSKTGWNKYSMQKNNN